MESECEPKPYEASFVDGPRSRCLCSLEWGDSEWRQNDLIYNWSWFHCIALLSLSLSLLVLSHLHPLLCSFMTHARTHTHTQPQMHTHALAWHFSDPIFLLFLIPDLEKKCLKRKKLSGGKVGFLNQRQNCGGQN